MATSRACRLESRMTSKRGSSDLNPHFWVDMSMARPMIHKGIISAFYVVFRYSSGNILEKEGDSEKRED